MTDHRKYSLVLVFLLILGIGYFYFSGIPSVPFHPDEATQIFMSRDVDAILSDPESLVYQPGSKSLEQRYRLMDAPLTRYFIGIARILARQDVIDADWSWSVSWQENIVKGAFPNPSLLFIARLAIAWLYPLTLLFFFLSARRIIDPLIAVYLTALLGLNPLLLLHTRHAMAEGILLFAICFSTFLFQTGDKIGSKSGLLNALLLSSKQNAGALIPVGWINLFRDTNRKQNWTSGLKSIALSMLISVGIMLMLNPVLWNQPMEALSEAVRLRKDFTYQQTQLMRQNSAGQVLDGITYRMAALIGQSQLTSPAYFDVGNYQNELKDSIIGYEAIPINLLLNNLIYKLVMFFFSFLGFFLAALAIIRGKPYTDWSLHSLMLGTIFTALFMLVFIQVGFQRYYLPIIPFTTLWAGYAFQVLIGWFIPKH
jgi:hypothetical protein